MDYVTALGQSYPTITFQCLGDPTVYENIQHLGGPALPTKQDLDALIITINQANTWKLIQAERDRRKSSGVKVGTNWFHSDDPSRIQQIALVMFGANMPTGIMWKTMHGTFVSMTPTLAMQIFQSIAASDQIIFAKAEQHRSQMMALANPLDYDYFTGWPIAFDES